MAGAIIKTKYIGAGRACFHNNNNLPDLAPLEYDKETDTLWVEGGQYDAWALTDALEMLDFKHIKRLDRPAKKLDARTFCDAPEWFHRVYAPINARSNAIRWWSETIKKDGIIPLTEEQSITLAGDEASPKTIHARRWLKLYIQEIMDAHPDVAQKDGWFVKCGACSTKHQYPVEPVFSGAEAVTHLLGADPIRSALSKGLALCFAIRPWVPAISHNNEFRVFVRQGKVTGISQQACYSHVVNVVALFKPEDVIEAAQKCFDDFTAKLEPRHRLVYECTFDAYLECPDEVPIIHLIEINAEAFGWGPAGSSLFDWRTDPPPKPDETAVIYITM